MTDAIKTGFIIAGVQKGGTTALFDYLSEEPGLAVSDAKEVHFFDDESVDWAQPDYRPYHARFPPPDGRLRGEATPIYLYWPGSLARIATYNPAMRLIVMLRDPVERAWSHWRMEYARGAEREPFAWCIRQGRRRLFDAEPWGHHREYSYVERGFYGEQLERLYGLFPREQVLLLRSGELSDEPAATLSRVRSFLALAAAAAAQARQVHVGRAMDYGSELTADDIGHLRRIYADDQARMKALAGFDFQG